jgi:uncharacterized membrane protein (TIGR02234 family)
MSRARREMVLVVVLTVVGAGVLLLVSGQTWAHAVVREPPLPQTVVNLPGRTVAPLVAALGIVGLAAVIALLATRGIARVVIGAVIAICGAVVVAATASVSATDVRNGSALRDRASAAALRDAQVSVRLESWRHVAAAGGLVLVAAGLFAAARGRTWSGMGRRFDAPTLAPSQPAVPAAGVAEEPAGRAADDADDADLWARIERGDDPTV